MRAARAAPGVGPRGRHGTATVGGAAAPWPMPLRDLVLDVEAIHEGDLEKTGAIEHYRGAEEA
jgi:hypothetical protein